MQKHIILIYLLAITFITTAQNSSTGIVIDKNENYPIYGAHISVNNTPVTATNIDGFFEIKADHINVVDTIKIEHIAYKTVKITLDSLLKNNTILLKRESILLDDVVVYKDKEKLRPYIKKLRKAYKKTMADYNHWLEVNSKTLFLYKNKPFFYFEYDGYLFNTGSRIPYHYPFIIPSEERMTKPFLKSSKYHIKKTARLYNELDILSHEDICLLSYTKQWHPLNKTNHNKFIFKRKEYETIKDKTCEILEYRQGVKIKKDTYNITCFNGKMWIDEKTGKIIRETISFTKEMYHPQGKWSVLADIKYFTKEGRQFIHKVHLNIYDNQNQLKYRNIIACKNADILERKWYNRKFYYPYDLDFHLDSTKNYDKNYWDKYPFIKNTFRTELKELAGDKTIDQIFMEGAKVELLDKKNRVYKTYHQTTTKSRNILFRKHLKTDLNLK